MARLPEQKAWDNFRDFINPWELLLHRVENVCGNGMSDVVGINKNKVVFWIENKAIAHWPARDGTRPMVDAFEPGQIPFMRQWKHWGGNAFVLLRVGTDFLLLDPVLPLTEMIKAHLIDSAVATGKKHICEHLESLK
jgi:hypothetical protein